MGNRELLLSSDSKYAYSPKLAAIIGINETLFLSQLQFWIGNKENDGNERYCHEGRVWIYNTYEQWHEQLPFFSVRTIRRIINSLEKSGIIMSSKFNRKGYDNTKWYTINYDALDRYGECPEDEKDTVHVVHVTWTTCPRDLDKVDRPIPENTTKNNYTKNINKLNKSNGAESGDSAQCALQSDDAHPAPQGCDNNIISGNPDDTASHRNVPTTVVYKILDRQVKKCCNELGYRFEETREICKIIGYFFDVYNTEMGMPHPVLNNKTMTNCIIAIHDDYGKGDGSYFPYFDEYKPLIDSYFNKVILECDFHLPHFVSGEIRQNLYYEIMSGCAV